MRPPLRRPLLLALALLLGAAAAPALHAQQGYTHLHIQHPQEPWRSSPGTIEEATVVVRPKGAFAEIGLYLTFSARSGGFRTDDSLEVQLHFTLPPEAAVTDSWLWVGDDIIRADLLDSWTASQIYENIVRRRRDPSILLKESATQYSLRIYPMGGTETRRVRLEYLVPARWTAQAVTVPLPAELLDASWQRGQKLEVVTFPSATWTNPRLLEHPEADFSLVEEDEVFGKHLRATLPWEAAHGGLTLAVVAPLADGLFVQRSAEEAEDGAAFYQLVLLPGEALDLRRARKVAVLFDYDASKTDVALNAVIEAARSQLHASLTPADSFALIYSQLDVKRIGEGWLAAHAASIDAAFDALEADPPATYSNLPTLLAAGLDFVRDEGTGGALLVLSSSDQVGALEVANRLIDDLEARSGALPPTHVVDLTTRNFTYYQIGGRYFAGNEYFFANLTRLTGGNYEALRNGPALAEALARLTTAVSGPVSAFDLHTTLADGFCFARFASHTGNRVVYLDEPIVEVGKCFGGADFVVETSGLFDGEPFSARRQVAAAASADATLRAFWAGRQIATLEAAPPTNDVITGLINLSIDERVLSLYTAFLALEPGQGGEICETCRADDAAGEDGNPAEPTDIDDEAPDDGAASIEVFPNPFRTQTTIRVTLPQPLDAGQVSVEIFDVMGRRVRTLDAGATSLVQELQLTWDGTNDAGQAVASGTYFVVVTTPAGRFTRSVVLVR